MKMGLRDVIPEKFLKLLRPCDLVRLISGPLEIDVDEWRAAVAYPNFSRKYANLRSWFWEWVCSLEQEELRKLLAFWTGSTLPPVGGFTASNSSQDYAEDEGSLVLIILDSESPQMLPKSMTCDKMLEMPRYRSRKELEKKFSMAIQFGAEGFAYV